MVFHNELSEKIQSFIGIILNRIKIFCSINFNNSQYEKTEITFGTMTSEIKMAIAIKIN